MNLLKKLLVGVSLISASVFANAGLISVNDNSVNVLELGATEFSSFYKLGDGNQYSANTGLELPNQMVIFIAQKGNGEFGIFNIFSGLAGVKGNLDVTATGSQGFVSFVDDNTESDLKFKWDWGRSDGLIFSGIFGDSWTVNFDYTNSKGIRGLSVYTFDDSGNASLAFISAGSPKSVNITSSIPRIASATSVNAPTATFMFLLSIAFIIMQLRAKS
jgi:hypothetical protein